MTNFLMWLQAVMSIITLLGVVYAIYRTFSDPDIKSKNRIDIMENSCGLKHQRLDELILEMRENFKSINESVLLMKENDIKHIENNIRDIRISQTKILTILEYKDTEEKSNLK